MYSDDDDPRSFDENNLRDLYREYLKVGSIRGFVKKHGATYHFARSRIIMAHSLYKDCLLYTSPSPRDRQKSRMPSSA